MMRRLLIIFFPVLGFILAACAAPGSGPNQEPSPGLNDESPTSYPAPEFTPPPSTPWVYPEPGSTIPPVPTQTNPPYPVPVEIPASGYEPTPGDENLVRGQVFLEIEQSEILVMESFPIQVQVILRGNLPDPCHQLRVIISGPDAQRRINLEVYSLLETGKACITVLEPFEASISLGSFSGGSYSVFVNGELLGKFDA
jgi:hypothetical protein